MARTKNQAKRQSKSKTKGRGRKTAPAKGGVKDKKKRRYRPGTLAMRKIKQY